MKRDEPLNPKLPGRYGRMTAAQFDKEVEKFDQEFIGLRARPLTARERTRDERAKRKRGRPRVGSGSKRVLVSIERALLNRSDELAKRRGISRARLIAEGLQMVLAKAG